MRLMTDEQRLLFATAMAPRRKSVGTAAILCAFLGLAGAHRFYVGQIGAGLAMTVLSLTVVGLVVTIPWAILDLIDARRLIARANDATAREVAAEIGAIDRPKASRG